MGRGAQVGTILGLALLAACGSKETSRPRPAETDETLPPDQRDAQDLGRELFEMVDRAMDYRGSHQGRPAASFRQMGVDSLTTTTVRRLVNIAREPVITVAFRKANTHEITSCRGDSQILEEATLNGGQFTVMCTSSSGAQRPMKVAGGSR